MTGGPDATARFVAAEARAKRFCVRPNRFIKVEQPVAHGFGDGGSTTVDAKLPAGVLDMVVDGPFRDAEDATGFPACLSDGGPLKAGKLPFGKGFH